MSAGVESELEKIIGNGDAGDNKVANDDTDDSNAKPKVKTKTIEKKSGDQMRLMSDVCVLSVANGLLTHENK